MTQSRDILNSDLLDAIAQDFHDEREVAVGTMFRNPGLRVGGKIFAFLGYHGELIIKVPQDRARELIESGAADNVTMGTRTMREWITIPPGEDRAATLDSWRPLTHEAHSYVKHLVSVEQR